jgi:hypothetical protein
VTNLEAHGTGQAFDLGVTPCFPAGHVPTTLDLYLLFVAAMYSGTYDGMGFAVQCADQARIMQDADLASLVADVPYGDPRVDFPDSPARGATGHLVVVRPFWRIGP